MAEINNPAERDAFLKSEREREEANFAEHLRLMQLHHDRLTNVHKEETPKNWESSIREHYEKIIDDYRKELKDNPIPYQSAIELNKKLNAEREMFIDHHKRYIEHLDRYFDYLEFLKEREE